MWLATDSPVEAVRAQGLRAASGGRASTAAGGSLKFLVCQLRNVFAIRIQGGLRGRREIENGSCYPSASQSLPAQLCKRGSSSPDSCRLRAPAPPPWKWRVRRRSLTVAEVGSILEAWGGGQGVGEEQGEAG